MNRWLITALSVWLFLACSHILSAQDPGKSKPVQVLSLTIEKPLPAKIDGIRPPSFSQGTTLKLLLSLPGKQIVAIDQSACKLASFADDKRTDLNDAKTAASDFGAPWVTDVFGDISKDGQFCAVIVRAPGVPADGATKIILKASLVMLCGTDEKTAEAKDIPLKLGTKTKLGPVQLAIEKERFGGGKGWQFTLTTPEVNQVKRFTVVGVDGKGIKSEPVGSVSGTVFGKSRHEYFFSLEGHAERATVRIVYFNKMESVTVPLDLQVGVGF
jgi:hypothetical protein